MWPIKNEPILIYVVSLWWCRISHNRRNIKKPILISTSTPVSSRTPLNDFGKATEERADTNTNTNMCKCNSKYKYNYRYKYKYDKRYKSTNTRYKKILPDHSNHCQSHVDNVDGMAARLEVYLGEKGSTHI